MIANPAQNMTMVRVHALWNQGSKWDNEDGPTGASTPTGPTRSDLTRVIEL